jgi:hypothetical protein
VQTHGAEAQIRLGLYRITATERQLQAPAAQVDAELLRLLEDSLLTLDLSLIFGHLDPLGHPPSSS